IVDRTNAFRKGEGRAPVATNADLAAAARYFADYMAANDEYGHTADGKGPGDRAKAHGYEYCIVLENIAYAFDSRGFDTGPLADEFFNGWKASPGHRKNMLDPDVTETAVAVARSAKTGYYYAVQMFGRPRSLAIEFKIENRSGEPVRYAVGGRTFELPPRVTRTHTRCRPAEVTFRWPGKEAGTAVKPANGDRFAVTKDGAAFAVKKE
ncbi:MAG: CAP domain-containing protein, partial [Planctomycetes bacterium]|nr:CAP domain-containing protein [Planctomycetota bacterium]